MEEHEGCLWEFMKVRHGGLSVWLVEHPATLQSFVVEHKAHLVDHTEAQNMDLDCHRQETAAVLHGFRDELEAQLPVQLAALSALALRQAAQESAAAAQLERRAALELGLQAALDERTAILQGFKDYLYAGFAGHMEEHVGCLREFLEEHHGGALGPAGGASCDAPEFHWGARGALR